MNNSKRRRLQKQAAAIAAKQGWLAHEVVPRGPRGPVVVGKPPPTGKPHNRRQKTRGFTPTS